MTSQVVLFFRTECKRIFMQIFSNKNPGLPTNLNEGHIFILVLVAKATEKNKKINNYSSDCFEIHLKDDTVSAVGNTSLNRIFHKDSTLKKLAPNTS